MKYCRTNEVIKWLMDGDIIQNLASEEYFKMDESKILISTDAIHWKNFEKPIEIFPPYDEWRSIMNLHYYNDIEGEKMYLTSNERVVSEDDPAADKSKKRWFIKF